MRKLMTANLRRLWKSNDLWVTCAICFTLSLFSSLESSQSVQLMEERGYGRIAEEYFYDMVPLLGLSLGAFASLFLGTEHADGTLRNKLTVGKRRSSVYLASFLTCQVAGILLLICWFLGASVFLPLSGLPLEYGWKGIALTGLLLVGTQTVFSAIYTWIGNLCTNKAMTVVYTLLAFGGLLILSSGIYDRLCEPEFTDTAMLYVDGVFVPQEGGPNPLYLSGTVRAFWQAAQELLPPGQGILIANVEVVHPVRMLLLSSAATVIILPLGMFFFQKKDLK